MLLYIFINTQYFSLKFWGGGQVGGIPGHPPLHETLLYGSVKISLINKINLKF